MAQTTDFSPGFQGSETSWVEVIIYQHGDDPVLLSSETKDRYVLDGKRINDPNHCVIAVTTNKSISEPAGSFTVTLKPSRRSKEIFEWLVDDDWIDIVFYRHSQPWHVVRGLVDDVTRGQVVTKSGATTTVYNIIGREWSKIFDITPVWFSPYADNDLVTDAVANQVFRAMPSVIGSPPVAVEAYLKGFINSLATYAGVNWNPPKGMPNIVNNSFLPSVLFNSNYFQNQPPRQAFNPNYLRPQGTLWQLAIQNSDPLFTEVYADLLPPDGPFSADIAEGNPLSPDDVQMTLVVRDKPFPVVDSAAEFSDWWSQVPVLAIPKQQVTNIDVGKHGYERFNAYFIASLLHQEAMGTHALEILAPLVDLEDIKRHGMRRMDVQSQQGPDPSDPDFGRMSDRQRRIARDWYCLNPYLLSGTIQLGLGRPDIKVGTRVRIPGVIDDNSRDETYYVEQVSHNYTFGLGTRTSLGVTRGWIGTDNSYLEYLQQISSRYTIPTLRRNQV